jgi:hypothetical protein
VIKGSYDKVPDRPAISNGMAKAVWAIPSVKNCNLDNSMISKSHAALKFEYITTFDIVELFCYWQDNPIIQKSQKESSMILV